MKLILKSLFWKELRELRAPAIAASAITLSMPLCFIARDRKLAFDAVLTAFWVYPLLASVFFGMRAAAGERAGGVGSFVAALPVSYHTLGAVRLVAICLAAAVPLLTLLPLGFALCFGRSFVEADTLSLGFPLTASLCGLSIFVTVCLISVVAAAGTGQPTEIRAGAIGVVALVGLWLAWGGAIIAVGILISVVLRPDFAGTQWNTYQTALQISQTAITVIAIGLTIVGPPIVFVARYGRALGPFDMPGWWHDVSWIRNRVLVRSFFADWSSKPWSASPWLALLWKSVREIGIVGLIVFLAALTLGAFATLVGLTGNDRARGFGRFAEGLPPVFWLGGFVLSILVGVGAAIADVQAGVNTFWRSRPISPAAWYWTKYATGLLIIFIAVELPAFACIVYRNPQPEEVNGWLVFMLIWNTTFSLALTMTCLVRQPLQAAILAIGAAGLLYAALSAAFLTVNEETGPLAISAFIAAFAMTLVVSTIAGAWAAERDVAIS